MPFSIIYTIVDGKDKTSFTELNIPDGLTLPNMLIFAVEITQLVDPLLTGKIDRVGLAATVPLSSITGIKTTAGASSDVEEGARFQWNTVNGFYTAMRLPTFDEALIQAGVDLVDLTDTDVAAFNTAMISGINLTSAGGTGTVSPVDKRGEDIVSLDFAKESFQSS